MQFDPKTRERAKRLATWKPIAVQLANGETLSFTLSQARMILGRMPFGSMPHAKLTAAIRQAEEEILRGRLE